MIKVSAFGKMQDGDWTGRLRMTTLNLVIAGQKIPVDVGPNTNIDVAGLGMVAVNSSADGPRRRAAELDLPPSGSRSTPSVPDFRSAP